MDVTSSDPVTLNGACHCGAVQFTATLPYGLSSARRCNCSLCRMRGAVVVTALVDGGLTVTAGEEFLATYQFNTKVAEHHFCTSCGIYTHHKRRGNPDEYGVNVACLEGLSPFDFPEVVVNEGRVHPLDADPAASNPVAGILRYEPRV
jgi:hypothetical protein